MKIKLGQALTFVEKASMIFTFLWLTKPFDLVLIKPLSLIIVFPTTVFFLLLRWKQTLWTFVQEKFLWLFIGLILFSLLWIPDFAAYYKHIKFVGTVLIGLSLAVRYSLKEQLEILAWTFGLVAVLSLFYCLAIPQRGIMGGAIFGPWSGIYPHKNYLGRAMTFSSMIFILQIMSHQQYRLLNLFFLTLSFTLLVLSKSISALLIFLTLLAVLPFYRALRWSYSWIIPFFSVVILTMGSLSLLLVPRLESFFGVFGKDLTLTGRIPLWEKIVEKIWERPWFGYGYGGFWTGKKGEAADIWRTQNWEAHHAHNGLLDLWLSVGLVGVVVATLVLATIFFRSLHCLRSSKSSSGIWPLWFLTLLILTNMTESTMGDRSIYWVFYIAVAISTHWKVRKQNDLIFEQRISPHSFAKNLKIIKKVNSYESK